MHHFEKYQGLTTSGAKAVEQFSIDGSLFLAFANARGDNERYDTDSFIYKMNDPTAQFSFYQTIDTTQARNIEYFTITDKHYLAVANHEGIYNRINSVIYEWNGTQFVVFQNISTNGATSFKFFKILKELFLAVTHMTSLKSIIYKWNNNQFEKFQEIGTEKAMASTVFAINNKTFIAFANFYSSQHRNTVQSTLFKWTGGSFVKVQSLQTYGAWDVKSFTINGSTFLAFANSYNDGNSTLDSFIYKWNGSHFVLFQSIPTRGAMALQLFVMCNQTFLGVANYWGKPVVYQASGERFIKYHELREARDWGTYDMTSFEYNGNTYIATATYYNGFGFNLKSTLFKWT